VTSGVAIFLIVLYFDHWASLGYLLAVAPIVGICIELAARTLTAGRGGHAPMSATVTAAG
jgi:hypothetical protein